MAEPHLYPITVHPLGQEDGGGYLALALDLPGCMADGETPQEAVTEAISAIGEWIDEAQRLDRPVPEPGTFTRRMAEQSKSMAEELAGLRADFDRFEAILQRVTLTIEAAKVVKTGQLVSIDDGGVFGSAWLTTLLPQPQH